MVKKSSSRPHFENNPFFITSGGITALAHNAQGVFVFLIVLSVLGLFPNNSPDPTEKDFDNFVTTLQSWTTSDWAVVGGAVLIIGLAIAMISALFGGVSSYTSAQLARGHAVNLRTAFRVSFENLWAYLWLQVIIVSKVVLWGLLFIVPGIIMAVRYSLAGVAFFDERKQLRGNAAVQESVRMTKNGWITTSAATTLFNVLTLGTVSSVISTGANAMLYKQFEQSGDKKPAAHWLSWLTLMLPLSLLLTFGLFVIIGMFVSGILVFPTN